MPSTKGNIYVKHGNGKGVYLYTAKFGHVLPSIVKSALTRVKGQWGDTPSITRAIFAELIQKDVFNINDAGISTSLVDNENFILVVDDKKKLIGVFGESGHCYSIYNFQQFLALPNTYLTTSALSGGHRIEHERPTPNTRTGDPYPLN